MGSLALCNSSMRSLRGCHGNAAKPCDVNCELMSPLSASSKLLLVLLVVLATSEFVVRGPVRYLRAADFNDFIPLYVQSKALIAGMDPYSPEILVRLWPLQGAHRPDFLAIDLADGSLIAKRGIPTAYPLTCLLLLTPLAVLPWPFAHIAWLLINLALILGVIWSLGRTMFSSEIPKIDDWRTYVFVAFAIALAPLHTGVAVGSLVISAACFCGIALVQEQSGRQIVAGILLGIAVCLKPQIGLPFVVFYLLRRRWRLTGVVAGVFSATAILAMARLAIGGSPWFQNYRIDNKVLLVSGILADFTERNPLRYSLINLQVLFYAMLRDRISANIFALVISAILFGIWLWLLLRRGIRNSDALLAVSTLAVLSLLPIYHRFYDAYLLIFPLCWSVREFSGSQRRLARGAFLLMLPFLVPGGTALEHLSHSAGFSESITRSWYWLCIVMPHEIWFLIALSWQLLRSMAHPSSLLPD